MLTIDTKNFAAMLGVQEREIVAALLTDGMLRGFKLPAPAKGFKGKTRRFDYDEAISFKEIFQKKNIP